MSAQAEYMYGRKEKCTVMRKYTYILYRVYILG